MRFFLNSIVGIATVLYPFAVYFGVRYVEPWVCAVLLCVLLLLRFLASSSQKQWTLPLLVAGIVYAVFAIWHNSLVSLRYYPVLVNAVMLLLFTWSLYHPPTIIERFARLQQPDLPDDGIRYTRCVTQVWCGFFVINGSIALVTALWASFELWSLYNGFIAYLLMAILFAGEYLIRRKIQLQVH